MPIFCATWNGRLPEVGTVRQLACELVLTFKARQVCVTVDSNTDHHGIELFGCTVAAAVRRRRRRRHSPTPSTTGMLFHRNHFRLEPDVLFQPEMIGVHAEVLEKLGVVEIVREVRRHRKVGVTHKCLHGVGNR